MSKRQAESTANATVFIIRDNIIGIQLPSVSPPSNSMSVKQVELSIANGQNYARSNPIRLTIANTACQTLVNGVYVVKVN